MNPASPQSISYPRRTIDRAERAVRCAPFLPNLFETMRYQSVDLRSIAGSAGVANRYTRRPVAELVAEADLLWLIEVGLLRREVDGQGLTDSFRLTPLGRQLVEKWQRQGGNWARATVFDRLVNTLSRWVRLPSWLQ